MDGQLDAVDDALDPPVGEADDSHAIIVAVSDVLNQEGAGEGEQEGEEGERVDEGEGAVEEGKAEEGEEESEPATRQRRNLPLWTIVWKGIVQDINQSQMVKLLVATLVASVISTLLNGAVSSHNHLATRRAPKPQRFFPINSPVIDLFDGNNGEPATLLSSAEIVVIMYYAPWSARSQEMRWHFDQVSRSFPYSQVRFVALNCWDPGGRCKQMFKLFSYPVVMAYVGSQSILYNSHWTADYIHKWLDSVINPFERLQSEAEAVDFLTSHDLALVGYFEFKSPFVNPPGFATFRTASIAALQEDPLRDELFFAIVTDAKLAQRLNLTRSGHTRLYQIAIGQEELDYPLDRPYASDKLLEWIKTNKIVDSSVQWIPQGVPIGVKSDHLQRMLAEGPLLLLLAPKEPLYPDQPDFAVFRQIAHEYFDCDYQPGAETNPDEFQTASESVVHQQVHLRRRRFEIIRDATRRCRLAHARRQQLSACCNDLIAPMTVASAYNICDVCFPKTSPPRWTYEQCVKAPMFFDAHHQSPVVLPEVVASESCEELSRLVPAPTLIDYCCDGKSRASSSSSSSGRKDCPRACNTESPKWTADDETTSADCRKLRLARQLKYDLARNDDSGREEPYIDEQFVGVYCKSNRTVRFAALDSRQYGHFVSKWGLKSSSVASVVLLDNATESVYSLDAPTALSTSALRAFITSFLNDSLSPHRLTEERTSTAFKNERRQEETRLLRVSAHSFDDVVLGVDGKDVVVLLTGGRGHGHSQGVLHVVHSVAMYLSDLNDRIKFAMKSDSARFPNNLPLTVPNLLAWVLARCQTEIRWRLALGVCSAACLRRNRERILLRLNQARTEARLLHALAYQHSGAAADLLWRQFARRRMQQRSLTHLFGLLNSLAKTKRAVLGSDDARVRDATFLEWMLKQRIGV
uniref:Thioredoxin domain-containing protein n=1 Tax=Plectus sambesii TaxID=2011161 RepID=A0A914XBW8_9BILA